MIAAHGTRGIQGELYGPAELGIAARSRSSAEHRQKITLRHTACSHRIPIAGAQWARRRGHRDGGVELETNNALRNAQERHSRMPGCGASYARTQRCAARVLVRFFRETTTIPCQPPVTCTCMSSVWDRRRLARGSRQPPCGEQPPATSAAFYIFSPTS